MLLSFWDKEHIFIIKKALLLVSYTSILIIISQNVFGCVIKNIAILKELHSIIRLLNLMLYFFFFYVCGVFCLSSVSLVDKCSFGECSPSSNLLLQNVYNLEDALFSLLDFKNLLDLEIVEDVCH